MEEAGGNTAQDTDKKQGDKVKGDYKKGDEKQGDEKQGDEKQSNNDKYGKNQRAIRNWSFRSRVV